MSDPEVLGHVERYLGARTHAVAVSGFSIGVHSSPSMVSAVTEGMRFRSLQSSLPLEFACSVLPGQEDLAVRLVEMFADSTVRSGAEVEYDDGFVVDEPLVPESLVRGLLAAPHPHADEMFNLFRQAGSRTAGPRLVAGSAPGSRRTGRVVRRPVVGRLPNGVRRGPSCPYRHFSVRRSATYPDSDIRPAFPGYRGHAACGRRPR